ncbi:MAG: FkbM family methyltransferase [Deltaproteobacteria bacterium]|jgi:FkbM family methyltransferase|nr:FkbM family methyltransferase [Deltaproteobacteria bacterium]
MLKDEFDSYLNSLYNNRTITNTSKLTRQDLTDNGIVIYGFGRQGKVVLEALLLQGITPEWIIDKNPKIVGSQIENISIRGADSLSKIKKQYVVLSSAYVNEMIAECEAHNVGNYILPYSLTNICYTTGEFGVSGDAGQWLEKIKKAHALLKDDASRKIFRNFIAFHLTFKAHCFDDYDPNIYFPVDLAPMIDYGFFIDVGAYAGDTLSAWVEHYKPEKRNDGYSYYAFEPCSDQFAELTSTIEALPEKTRKNIYPFKMALGDKDATFSISGSGLSAFINVNYDRESTVAEEAVIKRIDDLFADKKPTIIKADVEGFETRLLEGALSVIKRSRPTLALSVYHRFEDIFEIPLLIDGLNCGYDFYMRHHTPVYGETVCYAIPK